MIGTKYLCLLAYGNWLMFLLHVIKCVGTGVIQIPKSWHHPHTVNKTKGFLTLCTEWVWTPASFPPTQDLQNLVDSSYLSFYFTAHIEQANHHQHCFRIRLLKPMIRCRRSAQPKLKRPIKTVPYIFVIILTNLEWIPSHCFKMCSIPIAARFLQDISFGVHQLVWIWLRKSSWVSSRVWLKVTERVELVNRATSSWKRSVFSSDIQGLFGILTEEVVIA